MATVQGLGSDVGDALHGAGHGNTGGTLPVQGLQHPLIDLPLRVVLDHADLLSNNALLLGHALVSEVRHRHKGQQLPQILVKVLRAVEVVGRHGVAGKGIGLGAVFGHLLHGVSVGGVEHLVLQIVGDARRGILPYAVLLKAQVHAAVAGGEHGVFPGVAGLVDHIGRQTVFQAAEGHRLVNAGIIHPHASFPFRK